MPEGDTDQIEKSFLEKAREKAKGVANRKSAAIGGLSGGVSAATLLIVWQLFTPLTYFNQHAQSERDARTAQWRALQDAVNRQDSTARELERLQGYLHGAGIISINRSVKTNL